MSLGLWYFDKVFSDFKNPSINVNFIGINECEICILWELGKKKTNAQGNINSVYDLEKVKYLVPNCRSAMHVLHKNLEKRMQYGVLYSYPEIHKAVNSLEEKKLVTTYIQYRNRTRREVTLTFLGRLLFLREAVDIPQRFTYIRNHYEDTFPFFKLWEQLIEGIGKEKVLEACSATMNRCVLLVKNDFLLKDLRFTGYLKKEPSDLPIRFSGERDEMVADFFSKDSMKELLDSYIVYLIVHDLYYLQNLHANKHENIDLTSEKEYSYFDKGISKEKSLFKDNQLEELLPKYADIKHFITGMLIEELLWKKVS